MTFIFELQKVAKMGAIKRMDQIIDILNIYKRTRSIKATCKAAGCSRNTVRTYLRLARARDPELSIVLALPEEALRTVFYPKTAEKLPDWQVYFEGQIAHWVKELRKTGVTRHLLWEEYREAYPQGYGYTQFCVHFRELTGRKHLTLPIDHKPGQKLQLDYAGATIPWVDRQTGEVRQCQVLIAIMPHSQYTFAIALPSQKTADFVYGITEALRFMGGLPETIVSDNLKAFVIKPDRYEPDFNEIIVQLGLHYELHIEATRPARPKDKASVENAVRTAYTRLYAPLRNKTFHSPEEINIALREQLPLHNDKPFQKLEGSRSSVFEAAEKPLLRTLPSSPFQMKTTVKAKVNKSYHIFLAERGNYYSVPFRFVGKTAEIVYTRSSIEIYMGPKRVATHARFPAGSRDHYRTDHDHMPRNHQEWRRAEGFTGDHFRSQAQKIGPVTEWAMEQVLASRYNETQSYRSCMGVLSLAKKYGPDRLEAAAVRLRSAGKASYRRLTNVLEKNLDLALGIPDLFTPPEHDNIRGPSAYT
jgi:transposase